MNDETVMACIIYCDCGGKVHKVSEDQAWYYITVTHDIIFRGVCDTCHETVQVRRPISTLFFLAPSDGKKGN